MHVPREGTPHEADSITVEPNPSRLLNRKKDLQLDKSYKDTGYRVCKTPGGVLCSKRRKKSLLWGQQGAV